MKSFYQSYLLRIWWSDPVGAPDWHASLEDPHTHQVLSFPNPETLMSFLQGTLPPSEQTPNPTPHSKEEE